MMVKRVDLEGKVFGELTVIKEGGRDKWNRKRWVCQCSCGAKKEVNSRHLVNGRTKTCGCKAGLDLPKPFLGKKREMHPKWKGGSFICKDGYRMVYVGDGKYIREHRLVTQTTDPSLVVHHKNHVKTDNSPENLAPMTRSDHAVEHGLGVVSGNGKRKAR